MHKQDTDHPHHFQTAFRLTQSFPDVNHWPEDAICCAHTTIAIAVVCGVVCVFAMLLPLLPEFGPCGLFGVDFVVEGLRGDGYFALLGPLMLVWGVIFVYFNWFSMKIYMHN